MTATMTAADPLTIPATPVPYSAKLRSDIQALRGLAVVFGRVIATMFRDRVINPALFL